jgi:dTDP-glucose pyrophosphorylase
MAYVLAGGRGSRLLELTDWRAKPAVFFGGTSRIIDFALSNALNSGIRRIGVATQYKAHSLIRHLQRGWNFFRAERNESFDILPASQRVSGGAWYAGTADAVYQNIDIIESYAPRYIVILAGDHVYKMDYEPMLVQHVEQKADVTIACFALPVGEASAFGIMHVDEYDRILSFVEKPEHPPSMPGNPGMALASMGIYVFDTGFLLEQLRRDAAEAESSHSSPALFATEKRLRITLPAPACATAVRDRAIGAMWGRSTPIGRRTSTSPTWCRSLISMTATGRSGRLRRSIRLPSSCTTSTAAGDMRCRRWSRVAASCPEQPSGIPCCSPACFCDPTRRWTMPSYFPKWRSGAARGSAVSSSIAAFEFPPTSWSARTLKPTPPGSAEPTPVSV